MQDEKLLKTCIYIGIRGRVGDLYRGRIYILYRGRIEIYNGIRGRIRGRMKKPEENTTTQHITIITKNY